MRRPQHQGARELPCFRAFMRGIGAIMSAPRLRAGILKPVVRSSFESTSPVWWPSAHGALWRQSSALIGLRGERSNFESHRRRSVMACGQYLTVGGISIPSSRIKLSTEVARLEVIINLRDSDARQRAKANLKRRRRRQKAVAAFSLDSVSGVTGWRSSMSAKRKWRQG